MKGVDFVGLPVRAVELEKRDGLSQLLAFGVVEADTVADDVRVIDEAHGLRTLDRYNLFGHRLPNGVRVYRLSP